MTDDVENRIAKLEQELAALKSDKAKTPAPKVEKPFVMPRYDPTANFGMPASAVRAMVEAVPDSLMRSIVGDHRTVSQPGGFGEPPLQSESKLTIKGRGWQEAVPIGPDPNIKQIDRIAAHFDRMEKIEQAAKIAQAMKAKEGE
jgi:hypothetical protein